MARVLIVEDEEGDRVLLQNILESAGHEIFFAKEGEEAVKRFLRQGIEVVVTDLQMPHVDGMELITEILALFPDTPIIVVSGKDEEQLKMATVLGAATTLSKPVDPAKLIRAVQEAEAGLTS